MDGVLLPNMTHVPSPTLIRMSEDIDIKDMSSIYNLWLTYTTKLLGKVEDHTLIRLFATGVETFFYNDQLSPSPDQTSDECLQFLRNYSELEDVLALPMVNSVLNYLAYISRKLAGEHETPEDFIRLITTWEISGDKITEAVVMTLEVELIEE